LDFYDSPPVASDCARENILTAQPHQVSFIVNRVPARFKWTDLNSMYDRVIRRLQTPLKVAQTVTAFIPEEEYISENFGEYPFSARLAPRSIFSRKIDLMVFDILGSQIDIPESWERKKKLRKRSQRQKITKNITSYQAKNIRSIIQTYALVSCLYFFAIIIAFIAVAGIGLYGDQTLPSKMLHNFYVTTPVIIIVLIIAFFIIRSTFGLMHYYRDEYQFRRALIRAIGKGPNIGQRIALARLLLLRIATTVGSIIAILFALGLALDVVLFIFNPKFFD
jgi:hypothetical protein